MELYSDDGTPKNKVDFEEWINSREGRDIKFNLEKIDSRYTGLRRKFLEVREIIKSSNGSLEEISLKRSVVYKNKSFSRIYVLIPCNNHFWLSTRKRFDWNHFRVAATTDSEAIKRIIKKPEIGLVNKQ